LLHDVGDQYSDKQLLSLAERYRIPIDLTEARIPRLLHAAVGAEVLRHDWGVTDDELLDAIDVHVTGSSIMSPLAKVLFLADKLEPDRDRHYGGLDPIRALARLDLDAAVLKLYAWRVSELVTDGRPVDDRLIRARNALIERTLAVRR
jgi:predicted HD superfamily hydrolase involved in NAD metabolism